MTEAEEPDQWPGGGDPYMPHQPHDSLQHHRVQHHPGDPQQYDLFHEDSMDSHVSYHTHTSRPQLTGADAYHRFLWHNKHVLYELKLSVIVILGGIIVLACVVYIVLQCRARIRPAGNSSASRSSSSSSTSSGNQHGHFYHPRNRRDDEKELFGSNETLENLIPSEKNSIRLKVRKDQEFFV